MNHEGNNPHFLMQSEENGIRKGLDKNLSEIFIGNSANVPVLLNEWQVAVKSCDETISESVISIVVIPCSGIRNVFQNSG
jgi:hypothetical protein